MPVELFRIGASRSVTLREHGAQMKKNSRAFDFVLQSGACLDPFILSICSHPFLARLICLFSIKQYGGSNLRSRQFEANSRKVLVCFCRVRGWSNSSCRRSVLFKTKWFVPSTGRYQFVGHIILLSPHMLGFDLAWFVVTLLNCAAMFVSSRV